MKIVSIMNKGLFICIWLLATVWLAQAQTFKNPVLPGFNPDPSICRVNDDYYMVTSSFTWYPGIPIYHSKDLVNWEIVGHGISRPDMIDMNGLNDNDGIWAVTIRFHEGLFYFGMIMENVIISGIHGILKAHGRPNVLYGCKSWISAGINWWASVRF